MKGEQNPLTAVMEKAEVMVEERWNKIALFYGIPLYVTDNGNSTKVIWPEDPDKMAPEVMQTLLDTRGEEAVNAWLTEHFIAKAERDALEGED